MNISQFCFVQLEVTVKISLLSTMCIYIQLTTVNDMEAHEKLNRIFISTAVQFELLHFDRLHKVHLTALPVSEVMHPSQYGLKAP